LSSEVEPINGPKEVENMGKWNCVNKTMIQLNHFFGKSREKDKRTGEGLN